MGARSPPISSNTPSANLTTSPSAVSSSAVNSRPPSPLMTGLADVPLTLFGRELAHRLPQPGPGFLGGQTFNRARDL